MAKFRWAMALGLPMAILLTLGGRLAAADFADFMRVKELTIQELSVQLKDPDETIVFITLYELRQRGARSRQVAPDVAKLLAHPSWQSRIHAAYFLAGLDLEVDASIATVRAALEDADPKARATAAETLGQVVKTSQSIACCWGPAPSRIAQPALGKQVAEWLIPLLADPVAEVRAAAAKSLGHIGRDAAKAVGPLTEALHDDDRAVRLAVIQSLGPLGADAAAASPALCRLLQDRDPQLSMAAAWTLKQTDSEAFLSAAFPWLIVMVCDDQRDYGVRFAAQNILTDIGDGGRAAIPALCAMLTSQDPFVRQTAALGLTFGPEAAEAIAPLTTALGDSDAEVRTLAAYALARIGPAAAPAVPELIRLTADVDFRPPPAAAYALGRCQSRDAIPVLLQILAVEPAEEAADGLAREAAAALGEIGQEPEVVVPALIAALRHKHWDARRAAARSLSRFNQQADEIVPALVKVLKHDGGYLVLEQAADTLRRFGPEAVDAAIVSLVAALDSGQLNTRRTAALSLGLLDTDATSVARLTRMVGEDDEAGYAAARALGMMGAKAKAAVPALLEALGDTPAGAEAADALWRIDPAAASRAGVP